MDYSQQNSIFMPGLTRRGPVYNSTMMGALPALSPNVKLAIELGLIALGVTKKIPLPLAIGAAFLVWKLDGGSVTAPIPSGVNPADVNAPPPAFDSSQLQMPEVGIPSF